MREKRREVAQCLLHLDAHASRVPFLVAVASSHLSLCPLKQTAEIEDLQVRQQDTKSVYPIVTTTSVLCSRTGIPEENDGEQVNAAVLASAPNGSVRMHAMCVWQRLSVSERVPWTVSRSLICLIQARTILCASGIPCRLA